MAASRPTGGAGVLLGDLSCYFNAWIGRRSRLAGPPPAILGGGCSGACEVLH